MSEPVQNTLRMPTRTVESSPSGPPDRLQEIDQIGQRINGIIRFMCDIGNLPGISGEAREKAIGAFHDRLVVVEKQLSSIQEKLRLE